MGGVFVWSVVCGERGRGKWLGKGGKKKNIFFFFLETLLHLCRGQEVGSKRGFFVLNSVECYFLFKESDWGVGDGFFKKKLVK